ncbi:MAG: AAA family ATPase [Myxococcales bacterium]|nr:AAA family ATPase [Myxococcales bacterium]
MPPDPRLDPLLKLALPAHGALDWERLCARFQFLQTLVGVAQDPVHHAEGDVAVHTRMVCEALLALPAWQGLDPEGQSLTFAAALFHDIAKPATTRCEADGRITARGHSALGERLARVELWRAGLDFAHREQICAMVRYHQQPFFATSQPDSLRLVAKMSQSLRNDYVALLAEADMRGRVCEDQAAVLDAIAYFRLFAEDAGCLDGPLGFANPTSRYEYFQRPERDPGYAAFEGEQFEVVVMSGLPGAGKDHWVKTHGEGRPVVSLDALRLAMGVSADDDQGRVVQAAEALAREHLRARRPFVWNATNLTRQRRAPLVALMSRYGARVRIVHVEAPEATLRAVQRARSEATRVPERVLDAMISRWELPDPTEAPLVEYVVRSEE